MCWFLSAFQFVTTLVFVVTCLMVRDHTAIGFLLEYERKWAWLIYAMPSSTAATEVILAGSMCYWLYRSRELGMIRYTFCPK